MTTMGKRNLPPGILGCISRARAKRRREARQARRDLIEEAHPGLFSDTEKDELWEHKEAYDAVLALRAACEELTEAEGHLPRDHRGTLLHIAEASEWISHAVEVMREVREGERG